MRRRIRKNIMGEIVWESKRATHNKLVDLPVVVIFDERVEVPVLPSRLERSN